MWQKRMKLINMSEDSLEDVLIIDNLSWINEKNYSSSVIYLYINNKTEISSSGIVIRDIKHVKGIVC